MILSFVIKQRAASVTCHITWSTTLDIQMIPMPWNQHVQIGGKPDKELIRQFQKRFCSDQLFLLFSQIFRYKVPSSVSYGADKSRGKLMPFDEEIASKTLTLHQFIGKKLRNHGSQIFYPFVESAWWDSAEMPLWNEVTIPLHIQLILYK